MVGGIVSNFVADWSVLHLLFETWRIVATYLDLNQVYDIDLRMEIRNLADGKLIRQLFESKDPRLDKHKLEPPELMTLPTDDGEEVLLLVDSGSVLNAGPTSHAAETAILPIQGDSGRTASGASPLAGLPGSVSWKK